MSGKRLFILLFSLSVFCQPCWAGRENSNALCSEADTTVKMQICLNHELDKAEALMAERLEYLMACVSGQKEQLLQAQAAWVYFRQKNSDFEAGGESGGTLFAVERLAIMVEMTQKRADELEKLGLKFCNGDFK